MRAKEVRGPLQSMSRMFGGRPAPESRPGAAPQPQHVPGAAGYPPGGAPTAPSSAGYPPGTAPAQGAPQHQASPGFLASIGHAAADVGRDIGALGAEVGSKLGLSDPPPQVGRRVEGSATAPLAGADLHWQPRPPCALP